MRDILKIDKNLFMIKLTPSIQGFNDFIGVWLYKDSAFTLLIDVGPRKTSDELIKKLKYIGVKNIDYICLTHVHIDHAGAIGEISNLFKKSLILCHELSKPNLFNPNKLWEGSLKNLNFIAKSYGKPIPIKNNVELCVKNLPLNKIKILKTPGHSPHHICILLERYLFLGEAAGVLLKMKSGNIYMRPATPEKFFIKIYIKSIINLLKVKTELLCYGHLEAVSIKYNTLQKHLDQIKLWECIIRKNISNNSKTDYDKIVKKCLKELIDVDPFLIPLEQMNAETKKRELFFIKNSIKGFIGTIKNES